tara:strand:- start:2878 stop:3540 length:663 start_codon:yes stop_codon:yes gene_type:complete
MKNSIFRISAGIALLSIPTTAYAHHPLAGAPMETFAHGLLSGIGHPLLGFDHLFFVLAVGIAAATIVRRFVAPAAYVGAMLLGCFVMSIGIGLPAKELVISVSLVVAGAALIRGRVLGTLPAALVFSVFGLFHGSAFGDAIAAQEASVGAHVLIGYLIGLGAIQYAIIVGVSWLVTGLMKAVEANDVRIRVAGGMVVGAGVFLVLENVEGMVFAIFGIGS